MNIYDAKELLRTMADKYYYMRMFLMNRNKKDLRKLQNELENRYGYFYWENGAECDVKCGATKAVFIPPEHDYVIKIPLKEEDGNETNYCKIEEENYQYACGCGLERYFAPCQDSFTYHYDPVDYDDYSYSLIIDIPVYIMEYADVNPIENSQYESQSNLYSMSSEYVEYTYDELDIIRIFSNFYSDNEIEELLFFLQVYSINDIHDANIGMLNGFPVLIDYSGYF